MGIVAAGFAQLGSNAIIFPPPAVPPRTLKERYCGNENFKAGPFSSSSSSFYSSSWLHSFIASHKLTTTLRSFNRLLDSARKMLHTVPLL